MLFALGANDTYLFVMNLASLLQEKYDFPLSYAVESIFYWFLHLQLDPQASTLIK